MKRGSTASLELFLENQGATAVGFDVRFGHDGLERRLHIEPGSFEASVPPPKLGPVDDDLVDVTLDPVAEAPLSSVRVRYTCFGPCLRAPTSARSASSSD